MVREPTGFVSGLELLGLAGDGLFGSGLSWGFEVASGNAGLVGSGVTFSGSAVMPPVVSSCSTSVDEGMWVVRASSSAGETLIEGSWMSWS